MYHYTGSGLANVWLVNGYTEHDTPYGRSVSIADIEGLHRVIGEDIVNRPPGRMAGEAVRFLRKEMDLSQQSLAELIGVKEITVRKWEQKNCPPGPAQTLLRAIYARHIHGDDRLSQIMEDLRRQDHALPEQVALRFKDDPERGWQRERLAA